MIESTRPTRLFCFLSGLSGVAGVIMLIVSFTINTGPALGAPPAEFAKYVSESYASILWGAWLQAIGPVFIVLFAFALVHLGRATNHLAGWMTFFGASVLMTVSLIEITFYISALYASPSMMTPISFKLIYSIQHLYFIVAAPALFLPLGVVLLNCAVLPRVFGYLALLLGAGFGIVGMASLLTLTLPAAVTSLGGIQAIWWLAAAIALIFRNRRAAQFAAKAKCSGI
jgi:hypothetical protein